MAQLRSDLEEGLVGAQAPLSSGAAAAQPQPSAPQTLACEERRAVNEEGATYLSWLDAAPQNGETWATTVPEQDPVKPPLWVGISCQWGNLTEVDPIKETFRAKVEISLVFEPRDLLKNAAGKMRSPSDFYFAEIPPKKRSADALEEAKTSDGAMRWVLKYLKRHESSKPGDQIQWLANANLSVPVLDMKNVVDGRWVNEFISFQESSKRYPRGLLRVYLEYQGTFRTPFDLHRYPFDRQLLEVEIGTKVPTKNQVFVPYAAVAKRGPSKAKVSKQIDEYQIVAHHLYIQPLDELQVMPSGDSFGRTLMVLQVQRNPNWALTNIVAVLGGFLVSMNIAFAFQDLFLRLMANSVPSISICIYRVAISRDLPKKGYQTWVNKYFIFTIFASIIVNLYFCCFGGGREHALDRLFQVIFNCALAVGHVGLLWVWCWDRSWAYKKWSECKKLKEESLFSGEAPSSSGCFREAFHRWRARSQEATGAGAA